MKSSEKEKTSSAKSIDATTSNKFSYQLLELPDTLSLPQPLAVKVKLTGDEEAHQIRVWSYLYRGSKCYSCGEREREDNAKEVLLKKNGEETVTFYLNTPSETDEGEYKVMVKLQKDGQKTIHDLTQSIYLYGKEESSSSAKLITMANSEPERSNFTLPKASKAPFPGATGYVVYESSTEMAKNVVPYFLIVTVILLGVILLRKT